MLQPVETWNIQDATKIQNYMTCPRQYLFEYVFGWRPARPSVHLEHGIAMHKAMEVFYSGGEPDLSRDAVARACEAYYKHYRSVFTMEADEENAPKNPECTWRALEQYAEFYKGLDDFEVLHTEVAGSVMLDESRRLYFKQDVMARDANTNRIFSLDHKTGTSFTSAWANQWSQKIQLGVYTHVLYCLYDPEEIFGARINGIFVRKPPTLKKDGTMRAGARDNEFHRVPVAKSPKQMQDWANTITYWLIQLEADFETLSVELDSAEFLTAFPKNTESCTKYFGCPFQPYCATWQNPVQHIEEVPLGYTVNHWDPRSKFDEAKEVVEL